MAGENSQWAAGFYAFIVGGIIIIISLNLTLYKYMTEKPKDGTQWEVLTIQIQEMRSVLDPAVFDYFMDKAIEFRDKLTRNLPLVAHACWNDFSMLILFRIIFTLNMLPLLFLFFIVIFVQALVKRTEKEVSFGNFNVLQFEFCKQILITTMFFLFTGYVTLPFQFQDMFLIYMGISFFLILSCIYFIISNLPHKVIGG